MQSIQITENKKQRTAALIESLTQLWESSVRASHDFLSDADINSLKPYVREALKGIETLVVATDNGGYVAFMGLQERKIEMLFVSPEYFGKGIGRRLVDLAVNEYGAVYVDVNEQNPKAAGFYRHLGFAVFRRDAVDDQGNAFPILRMKLIKDDGQGA